MKTIEDEYINGLCIPKKLFKSEVFDRDITLEMMQLYHDEIGEDFLDSHSHIIPLGVFYGYMLAKFPLCKKEILLELNDEYGHIRSLEPEICLYYGLNESDADDLFYQTFIELCNLTVLTKRRVNELLYHVIDISTYSKINVATIEDFLMSRVEMDDYGSYVWASDKSGNNIQMVLSFSSEKASNESHWKLEQSIGKFIAEAINEKLSGKELKTTETQENFGYFKSPLLYDSNSTKFLYTNTEDLPKIAIDLRGWGAIQHLFDCEEKAAAFQDSVGVYISEAINKKIERCGK